MIIEEIPVEYEFIQKNVPEKWKDMQPDFVVHVGVKSRAKSVTLEVLAHNDGYKGPDVKSCYPPGHCCLPGGANTLKSSLDLPDLCRSVNLSCTETGLEVATCLSENAGRYLCEFIYYKSLHAMQGKSLFIHVPPLDHPYSVLQLSQALRMILQNIIKQIKH